MKITVEKNDFQKIELTIPEFSSLETWEETIRVILKWSSFTEKSIDDLFGVDEEGKPNE